MKPLKLVHLVQLFLTLTVVSLSAQAQAGAELTLSARGKLAIKIASQLYPAQDKDFTASKMKNTPKGGYLANSWQFTTSPTPRSPSTLSDGMTVVKLGKSVGYVDASGRFLGLTAP